jgi:hypothetical protein
MDKEKFLEASELYDMIFYCEEILDHLDDVVIGYAKSGGGIRKIPMSIESHYKVRDIVKESIAQRLDLVRSEFEAL